MKTLKSLFLSIFVFISSVSAFAAWDIYKSGVSINGGYYDCLLNTAAPEFQHSYFGRYSTGGTITIDFAEVLTYKNGASNVCSANLQYRVYRTCDVAPSYTTYSLPYCCDFGGTNCTGGACGPDVNNSGDQKWRGATSVNILSGLTLPGVYVIELYYDATGDDAGGCTQTKYSSNSSNNYRAYFELNINDSFTDGQFTTNPTWSGDTGNMQVVSNSNVSGLIGTEQTRTHTLKLNVASGAGSQYLSTPISTWDAQQEWQFWIGRDNGNAATSANQVMVWLFANEANLESATVDGYRIVYGDDSGGDDVILQSVTNGVGTNIITSSTSTANGLIDYGIAIRLTRNQNNGWTLYTSSLPQNSTQAQATPTPLSCIATSATISQGTATNADYTISGTGYVGPVFIHSSGVGERSSAEFDNLKVEALPPNTEVKIIGATSGTVAEDAANTGNLEIQIQLANPSSTLATSVDLVLTSGASVRAGRGTVINTNYAGPYTTITLTWAAGTSGVQYVYIDPADNALCDDIATLVFTLQNVVGGNSAYIGTPNAYTATIVDDNTGYDTIITETFETGSIPATWITTGTAWAANSATPITGVFSARHSTQASAGTSSLAAPIDDMSLPGVNTTWRFQIKYTSDASPNNNFQVFLSANEANFYSATVDGYAVVVDQTSLPSAGANDYIRLYRVTNGAYAATPIVNSAIDWESNVNGGIKVGFEVSLNDNGTWTLKIDNNGDFDNLVTLGTGVDVAGGDITYPLMQFFGPRFKYTPGLSNFLRIDDILVTQKGCKETWYSQTTGNANGVVWGPQPVSTAQTVVGGRYRRFTVQNAHTVTTSADWVVNDLAIDAGATLAAGSATTRVFGNWVNSGTYTEGTGTVVFRGTAAQLVLGAGTTFNNLTIDNDGFNVSLLSPASVKGAVRPVEGTLQTLGNLTLLSSSTGSASIGAIQTAAAVSGNVTLQRYIPSIPWVYGNWVNLGCPIQGQTIAEWNDDMITTGFLGSDYPPPYPFNNIRKYDEDSIGVMNKGYVFATNVTNTLSNSKGYFVWLQGGAQNIDNTGNIQVGPFNQALSYTPGGGILNDGWNLMTNPFPSEVDWNLVTSTFSASNPKVYYVFDHQTNAYKNYNATSGTGTASRYIPHSQSFLVKVNTGSQNLVYNESYKTNVGTAFERDNTGEGQFVALKLERNGMSDESILSFNSTADAGYEAWDVFDLESPNEDAVEFSLMSADNINLAQDCRPLVADVNIPVYLDLPEAGTYTFSVVQTQNLPLGTCLMIEDLLTGNAINLQAGEQMTITTSASYQGNRLVIHASAPVQVLSSDATCAGIANGTIDVTAPAGTWNIVLEGQGNNNEFVANGSATFDHLPAGTYVISVSNGSECGTSSQTVVINEPLTIQTSLIGTTYSSCNTQQNGIIEMEVQNAEWFNYEVVSSKNTVVASGSVEGNTLTIADLKGDIYQVNIYTNCSTEHLEVNLMDPEMVSLSAIDAPTQAILANGVAQITYSAESNTESIFWVCNNGETGIGNSFTVNASVEGAIVVTAIAMKGECSVFNTATTQVKSATIATAENSALSMLQLENALQISAGSAFAESNLNIEVLDAAGRLIFAQTKVVQGGQVIMVPTDKLSNGIYHLRITSNGENIFTKKFVK